MSDRESDDSRRPASPDHAGPVFVTAMALLVVGATIALLGTSLLLVLSSFEMRREAGEFVSPLISATSTSMLVLILGGSPYHLNRGRIPWPVLWLASIVCILGITVVVILIADATGTEEGTAGLSALVLMVPVCIWCAIAIPVTELVLRAGEREPESRGGSRASP